MGQAADIALVTQKDSEDDGGAAPKPAEAQPGALDNNGTTERVGAPLRHDEAESPAPSPTLGPYRREDAVSITLPAAASPGVSSQAPTYALGTTLAEAESADSPDPAPDSPALPVTKDTQPGDPDSLSTMAVDTIPDAQHPELPNHREPSADLGANEAVESEPSHAYVRGAWDKPPPLTAVPPWVWRDVPPDIFPHAPTLPPGVTANSPTAASSDEMSPPAAEESARPAQPSSLEAKALPGASPDAPVPMPPAEPAPPPAVSPAATEPPRPSETDNQPRRATAWRPTQTPAQDASSPTSGGLPPPDIVQKPELRARIEPAWERQPTQTAFQDARPSDFTRDRLAPPIVDAWARYKDIGRTALRYAGYAAAGYFALVFVLILLYRFVNPPASSLMLVQALTGTDVQQQWVPLDEISSSLVRAVIVSEDWSFCEHYGIDIAAIEQAIEKSGDGIPRGASTISMQTTKNLFLWNAKSYIRKAVEVPLTLMIELVWPKSRILEIYLNVAEWGPGIFGAEAAARYHFNKPASRLDSREAAQLAASLPNPIIREAGDPGPRTARKASVIQSRMRNAGGAAACVLGNRR